MEREAGAGDARRPPPDGRDAHGGGTLPPLVEAKLAAPGVRRSMVDRPRIGRALDGDEGTRLTLVAAPAGYGKTTAVRAWCARRGAAMAWVTLDAGDNDPARLWSYVATAIERVRPGLGHGALRRLSAGGGSVGDAVDELTNAVAAYRHDLVIVLDDLHAVTDAQCLSSIDRALEHLPGNARLVVLTRVDPALQLARPRAAGALAEVRADELAFTPAEAHELLADRGHLDLDGPEIDLLVGRTEGWPAALVLAGLWLRRVDDVHGAVRRFGGDQRFVSEYLSSEVLTSLDDDRRSFLQGAAVLGRVTPELCDHVLGRTDSGAVLDELERANLFTARLEHGRWYRVHQLFAEFAEARLAAAEPAAPRRMHATAAAWLRSRGMPTEAVEHAARAGDHELLAELLVEYHVPLIRDGHGRTFLRWVEMLPDDHVAAHPELAVGGAISAVLIGQAAMAPRRWLALADRAAGERAGATDPYVEGWTCVVRALTIDDGVERAVRDARRALELAPRVTDVLLTAALVVGARALYLAGDQEAATAMALRFLAHPDAERRAPSMTVARATLALVAVARGQLAHARGHAEAAKAAAARIGISRSWLGAIACAAMGVVLSAEGRPAEAERELSLAEHLSRDELPTMNHAWLLALLARVRVGRGRLEQADAALRGARTEMEGLADGGIVTTLVAEVGRELATASGRARGGELLEHPSEAELTVLRLMATDRSTREIAEHLYLSPHTIRSHRRALYRKLGVSSREEMVARATALGLLG